MCVCLITSAILYVWTYIWSLLPSHIWFSFKSSLNIHTTWLCGYEAGIVLWFWILLCRTLGKCLWLLPQDDQCRVSDFWFGRNCVEAHICVCIFLWFCHHHLFDNWLCFDYVSMKLTVWHKTDRINTWP